jgi:uncharacterized coiled-coil protein SlyX
MERLVRFSRFNVDEFIRDVLHSDMPINEKLKKVPPYDLICSSVATLSDTVSELLLENAGLNKKIRNLESDAEKKERIFVYGLHYMKEYQRVEYEDYIKWAKVNLPNWNYDTSSDIRFKEFNNFYIRHGNAEKEIAFYNDCIDKLETQFANCKANVVKNNHLLLSMMVKHEDMEKDSKETIYNINQDLIAKVAEGRQYAAERDALIEKLRSASDIIGELEKDNVALKQKNLHLESLPSKIPKAYEWFFNGGLCSEVQDDKESKRFARDMHTQSFMDLAYTHTGMSTYQCWRAGRGLASFLVYGKK